VDGWYIPITIQVAEIDREEVRRLARICEQTKKGRVKKKLRNRIEHMIIKCFITVHQH